MATLTESDSRVARERIKTNMNVGVWQKEFSHPLSVCRIHSQDSLFRDLKRSINVRQTERIGAKFRSDSIRFSGFLQATTLWPIIDESLWRRRQKHTHPKDSAFGAMKEGRGNYASLHAQDWAMDMVVCEKVVELTREK